MVEFIFAFEHFVVDSFMNLGVHFVNCLSVFLHELQVSLFLDAESFVLLSLFFSLFNLLFLDHFLGHLFLLVFLILAH